MQDYPIDLGRAMSLQLGMLRGMLLEKLVMKPNKDLLEFGLYVDVHFSDLSA